MKEEVDKLRDQQAGFRKNRSCTDQIATLRIIIEQCAEWNFSLYAGFIDYEKALDSVDREIIWKLLRHYGVPCKLVNIICNSYEHLTCRAIHGGQLTEPFEVKTGVRQGCLLSPFLFLLAIDWIMKSSTDNRINGLQWTPWSQLEALSQFMYIVEFTLFVSFRDWSNTYRYLHVHLRICVYIDNGKLDRQISNAHRTA
jgi:hypothetical protein